MALQNGSAGIPFVGRIGRKNCMQPAYNSKKLKNAWGKTVTRSARAVASLRGSWQAGQASDEPVGGRTSSH